MKKIFSALVMLFCIFAVLGCQNNQGTNNPNSPATGALTIRYPFTGLYSPACEKLILYPGQKITLMSILFRQDAEQYDFNAGQSVAANWTISPSLGRLDKNQGEQVNLTVSDTLSLGTSDLYVKCEYNGLEKRIPVIIDRLNVEFNIQNDPGYVVIGEPIRISVTIKRSDSTEEKDTFLIWNTPEASFSDQFGCKSGDWSEIILSETPLIEMSFACTIYGEHYRSKTYTIKRTSSVEE